MHGVIFICFSSLVSGILTALTFEGPCPELKGVENINMTSFTGAPWYELARFPDDWEGQGDCTVLYFEKDNIEINFILNSVVNSKLKIIEGSVDYDKQSNRSDILIFKSKSFKGPEKDVSLPLQILAIVYDKYYIGFECKYNGEKNLRHEYLWITSRTKQLDTKSKMAVDDVIKSYKIFDTEKLIWDHFNETTCKVES